MSPMLVLVKCICLQTWDAHIKNVPDIPTRSQEHLSPRPTEGLWDFWWRLSLWLASASVHLVMRCHITMTWKMSTFLYRVSYHNPEFVKMFIKFTILRFILSLKTGNRIYMRHSDEISRMSQIPITLHEPINKCGLIWMIFRFLYYQH